MTPDTPSLAVSDTLDSASSLRRALRTHWGYNEFRPLQEPAMTSVLAGEDTLVVLPTGGGKSLCYQTPAVCLEGVAVVVSPLISLMKDQVDALTANGVPAACVNSTLTNQEKWRIADELAAGRLKLLYVAPERLCSDRMLQRLSQSRVSFFAIDEAHCVSHWGHDFRPHYRQLGQLRERFPDVGIHAFTATATERVRDDIVEQLSLRQPRVYVGSFDRPNLHYRVERRGKLLGQIAPILDRHRDRAGIIYCLSRKETEGLSAQLNELGYQSRPYHAGLSDEARHAHQEAFIRDEVQIIVATVAFGMGIDKPDVRFVIHTGVPKSIEHYQQETGRAGRDGLEAECWLFFGGKDLQTWDFLIQKQPADLQAASRDMLRSMLDYADGVACRHRLLVRHFGQDLDHDCGDACDVCQGEVAFVDDALRVSQMILSSIHRQERSYGSEYTARVLTANADDRVENNGHTQLSTYGLLKEHTIKSVQDWIGDLVRQGFLVRDPQYHTLSITDQGRMLLKGDAQPLLRRPVERSNDSGRRQRTSGPDSWEGVDEGLFEHLRQLRTEKAREQGVPPYIVFGDASLRDMARLRPTTVVGFQDVRGAGAKKCQAYGTDFVAAIAAYAQLHNLSTDVAQPTVVRPPARTAPQHDAPSGPALKSFPLFEAGASIEAAAAELDRAVTTVHGYLVDYLKSRQITDPAPWVDAETSALVLAADEATGHPDRLKPIFEYLDGAVDYDSLRIVLTCRRNRD
ncbi:MAG: DNA helicase RecQ [Planctomycetaceae bacterium]